jgi:hypothetical protein
MKKMLWIARTGRARKLQDMPRSDAAEPIEPLSWRTLADAELPLVSGGGGNPASGGGGGDNAPHIVGEPKKPLDTLVATTVGGTAV